MSSVRWHAGSRAIRIMMVVVGMTLVAPALSAQTNLNVYDLPDGSRWIAGCAENAVAERMLAHEVFQRTGPLGVLCVEGYTAVFKQLQ